MLFSGSSFSFLNDFSLAFGIKAFLVLFLVFYSVFALILLRQIQIMSTTLPTELSPLLKFIGIMHFGFSLAVLFLVIGNF